ncbi:MAG: alanine racemase [Pseudomonadota bacterium]
MRASLTVDLGAIVANWRALDAMTAPAVETAAVVKADAYGLGAARVAPALHAAGARSFFVAQTEEGAELRAILGPDPDIYVFGGLMPGDAPAHRAERLIPCLNSVEQARDFAASLPIEAPCAVQVDTGMNRLGEEPGRLPHLREVLAGRPRPRLILSHLACADAPDHPQNAAQLSAFTAARTALPADRYSLAATGGTLMEARFHGDLTRPGIGLYGGAPYADAKPVVTLALPVIQTREVAAGETVGYGASWTATRPSRIATVSAGYADGLIRAAGNGPVSLYHADGTACPLVGRISMDLITVDVTDLTAPTKTLEVLNAHQTVDTLAGAAGTIGYEILTSLGARYARTYSTG